MQNLKLSMPTELLCGIATELLLGGGASAELMPGPTTAELEESPFPM